MSGTPKVRVVRVRLDGQDDDAGAVAELLAQLLPELSDGRVQAGEISRPYQNRRGPGARRYVELYLLDDSPGRDADQPRNSHRSIQ
ncbi:hypothetical protein GCM10023196_035280 [Actinoallomurus vinaceus]|uniref:Uncharacterized protein n=1 Tax=Actinoallomurus vinaceus TaxID=1080074 RepID=A0ABP8UC29_9ACTN